MRVEVVDATDRLTPEGVAWLSERLAAAGGVLGTGGEARVRLVGDAEMACVHLQRLGVAGTTDVITFDLRERDPGSCPRVSGESVEHRGVGVVDVDVLICMDEAERQAARRGIEPRSEALLYAIHGLLHCLGHDDHAEAEAAAMHEVEDRTLVALGIGPVYRAGGGGGDGGERVEEGRGRARC